MLEKSDKIEQLSSILKKTGLRKIAVGLYMFTVCTALVAFSLIPAAIFAEISKYLILALFAGNALEHYVTNNPADKKEEPKI